jgi:CRP/FNR family transcriptional regulator
MSFEGLKTQAGTSPCVSCLSKISCLHNNLDVYELARITAEYTHKFRVKVGDAIFHNGDPIQSIYTVSTGFLKLEFSLSNGQHQVTRFASYGDLIGIDGMADGRHHLDAYALTDGVVCSLNYRRLQDLIQKEPVIQKSIERAMSNELNRTQEHLFSLGSHSVEEKLVYFILELLQKEGRFKSGLSYLHLPMNRVDLKSYLGITVESLSRALTFLEEAKFFRVKNREISHIDYLKLIQFLDITSEEGGRVN